MQSFTFHKATVNDIQILVDTRVDFLSEYWGKPDEQIVRNLRTELEKYFLRAVEEGTYTAWYAKSGEEIAGIGGMIIRQQPGGLNNVSGMIGYIMNMYTVQKFRRNGICRKILEKLIEYGKENGIKMFELHATKEGQEVYTQHGFQLRKEPAFRKFI